MKAQFSTLQGKTVAAVALMLSIGISLANEAIRDEQPRSLVIAMKTVAPAKHSPKSDKAADASVRGAIEALAVDNKRELELRLKSPSSGLVAEQ